MADSGSFSSGGRGRGTRARGRGRGRALDSQPAISPTIDPMLNQMVDLPASAISLSSVSGVPSVSKTNQTQGAGSTSMAKFKPRMVKRVAKAEGDDEGDDGEAGSGPGGRGRGRGRGWGADRGGRGRAEIVMTASGAFAMGPAEGGPRTGRFSQGPTRSGMRKIDNSVTPADGRSRAGTTTGSTVTPWDGGPSGLFDLYSDIDDDGSENGKENLENDSERAKVADLNDITLEHPMAPLSLPWDPKRIAEREKLVAERDRRMANLARLKLKREQEADVKPVVLLDTSATPSHSTTPLATRESTSTGTDSLLKGEPEAVKEASKHEIKLKREQLEELSKVGEQLLRSRLTTPNPVAGSQASRTESSGSNPSSLYIFQFPRHFPKFRDPSRAQPEQPSTTVDQKPGLGGPRKILKKKKPGLDDWMGWGKGGRQTECMGVPVGEEDKPVEGQIGELVIRRSGRVQMIIGDVAYDVLPAAQPTFHQEIAVIDPKPDGKLRAMFVLGPTHQKFLVAPDVSSLLKRDANENNNN